MTSDWINYKLQDIGQIITGKTPKGGNPLFEGMSVPFITPGDFRGNKITANSKRFISNEGAISVKNCILPKNAIMVTCIGDLGKVMLAERTCVTNQQINSVIVDETRFSADFIYYSLAIRGAVFNELAGGTVIQIVNKSAFSNISLAAPSLAVQLEIVNLLCALDDKIENLRAQNTALESIAQTLFRSWFVNFDPVHAKAAGNAPECMSPERAALFPSEFEESELGAVPKGWGGKRFCDTLNIHSGGTPKTAVAAYWGGAVPWFSVTDAPKPGQVFVLNTEKKITELGLSNSPARLLPARATIISARGTVGKTAMVEGRMSINQSCYALSPQQKFGEYWVYFQTLRLISQLKQMAHGGVFDTITKSTFEGISVVVPPTDIQEQFSRVCTPVFDIIANNGRLCLALASLRDHLLPALISGKLSIGEAEDAVEKLEM